MSVNKVIDWEFDQPSDGSSSLVRDLEAQIEVVLGQPEMEDVRDELELKQSSGDPWSLLSRLEVLQQLLRVRRSRMARS